MSTKNLDLALLKIQQEIPTIKKDANNPFFKSKYAPLEQILPVVLPILQKYGVLYSCAGHFADGNNFLEVCLIHVETGEKIHSLLPMINITDMQKLGAAYTYGMRYGLLPLLGICPEMDDDGNRASGKEDKPKEVKIEKRTLEKSLTVLYDEKKLLVPEEHRERLESVLASKDEEAKSKVRIYLNKLE